MKEYLIVYHYDNKKVTGIGNVRCETDRRLTLKTIREMEKSIKKTFMKGKGNVVIINIIKLENEEE